MISAVYDVVLFLSSDVSVIMFVLFAGDLRESGLLRCLDELEHSFY